MHKYEHIKSYFKTIYKYHLLNSTFFLFGNDRYKCSQCGAQFFESIQLRDHVAYRHQGIQLYRCKYCNRGFNCRPTMVRHERKTHTGYLPYVCKHCSLVWLFYLLNMYFWLLVFQCVSCRFWFENNWYVELLAVYD